MIGNCPCASNECIDQDETYPRQTETCSREGDYRAEIFTVCGFDATQEPVCLNVDEDSDEYRQIYRLMHSSLSKDVYRIQSVKRVLNNHLYRQYVRQQHSTRRMPKGVIVFHGTRSLAAEQICREGFDPNKSSNNDGLVWFALCASYSLHYSLSRRARPDPSGSLSMLVAELQTSAKSVAFVSSSQTYHTTNKNAAFPAYLVTFAYMPTPQQPLSTPRMCVIL